MAPLRAPRVTADSIFSGAPPPRLGRASAIWGDKTTAIPIHPNIDHLGYMDTESAIIALAALAQGTRLDAFPLLVRHEPEGLPAGEVAKALDVPQNTMSAHLAALTRAGLLRFERRSRLIIYRADLEQLKELTLFLVKDCCGGRPELCEPLIAELVPCC